MNFSIRKRIWASFLILVLVFVVNGVITIITETKIQSLSRHIATDVDPAEQLLQDFKAMIIESKMYATNWVFLRSNQEDKDALKKLHNKSYPQIQGKLRKLLPKLNNDTITTSIEMAFKEFDQLIIIEQDIMTQLGKFEDYDDPVKKMLAEQTIENEVIPRTAGMLARLDKAAAIAHNIETLHDNSREKYSSRLRVLIFLLACSVIGVGITLAIYFTRAITHPIQKIQKIVNDLGKGIINKVDYRESEDEIGQMVWSVNHLSGKLQETAGFAEAVGNRNYTLPFAPLSEEDKLGKALISMRDNIQKSEANLLKTAENLMQRNQALEQYTFIISHNLRAPVATILGFTQLLLSNAIGEEDRQTILDGLQQSAQNLDDVIHDLNRILEVKQQVHEGAEEVSLSRLAEDVIVLFKKIIAQEHIEIRLDFSQLDKINTLKGYLSSIFYNMVSNSIKYRRSDVKTVIKISSRKEGDKAVLLFRDNGKGIDMEKHGDKLFRLYERFDLTMEGKGMGLYMIKTQAENLGGIISVDSEVDKGTVFKIELPLQIE